jgi:hypothetical protein
MGVAGMTPEEIAEVQKTWSMVMTNVTEHSVTFLLKWWKADPKAMDLFSKFKGKSEAELKALPRLKAHGTHIFSAIDSIVKNLNDEAVVTELMHDLDRDHKTRTATLTKAQYDTFVGQAAGYLTGALGAALTPAGGSGYGKMLNFIGKSANIYH